MGIIVDAYNNCTTYNSYHRSFLESVNKTEEEMSRTEIKEKEPPKHKVGKWYKCIDNGDAASKFLVSGKYYKVVKEADFDREIRINEGERGSQDWLARRFDVESECDYDPNTEFKKSNYQHTAYVEFYNDDGSLYDKEYAYHCDEVVRQAWLNKQYMEKLHVEVEARGKIKRARMTGMSSYCNDVNATKNVIRVLETFLVALEENLSLIHI